jgi:hypothetical protein
LERNLENLSFYCSSPEFISSIDNVAWKRLMVLESRGISGSRKLGYWPSHELLQEIQDDVLVLSGRKSFRQIFPVWKAFEQVDRRVKKLRLKLRVDNLISRARALLPPSESELNKVVRLAITGNAQTQCSYRDMVLDPKKLAESLRADRQMERQRCMAQPLARWTVDIGHPMAKDFHYVAGISYTPEQVQAAWLRLRQRMRVRRHRLRKKTSLKSVTPI